MVSITTTTTIVIGLVIRQRHRHKLWHRQSHSRSHRHSHYWQDHHNWLSFPPQIENDTEINEARTNEGPNTTHFSFLAISACKMFLNVSIFTRFFKCLSSRLCWSNLPNSGAIKQSSKYIIIIINNNNKHFTNCSHSRQVTGRDRAMILRNPRFLFGVFRRGRVDNFLCALAAVDVARRAAGLRNQRLQADTFKVRVTNVQQVGVFQFCQIGRTTTRIFHFHFW